VKISRRGSVALLVSVGIVLHFAGGLSPATAADSPGGNDLDQVEELIAEGSYADAEVMAREILARQQATYGKDSLEVALVLDLLVQSMWRGGKAADPEVLEIAERAVAIKESILGPDDVEVGDSLLELGNVLHGRQEYEAAARIQRRALRCYEKALGPDDPRVAKAIHNLANSLGWLGEHTRAKELYERELEIFEKAYGPDSLDSADALLSLGNVFNELGESGEIELLQRSLTIYERELGPDHPNVATTLNNLGLVLLENGNYLRARDLLERSLAIRVQRLGEDNIETGGPHINLGILYSTIVDPSRAAEHYQRAVKVASAISHGVMEAVALANLGILKQDGGDYLESIRCYERALALFEDDLGPEHGRIAWALSSLGYAKMEIGDYGEARILLEKALEMVEDPEGGGQWLLPSLLSSLGELEEKTGNHEAARFRFEQAVKIAEKLHGTDHPTVASQLIDVAESYLAAGDARAAEQSFERALAILQSKEGAGNRNTTSALVGLAEVAHTQGNTKRAIEYYRLVLEIQEKAWGPDYPGIASTLTGLAAVLGEAGEDAEAFDVALRSEDLASEHLRVTTRGLAEREALSYASVQVSGLDMMLSLAADDPGPARAGPALDSLIRSRAVVLDEMARRHRLASISDDPEVESAAAELEAARSWLAHLTVRGPGDLEPEQYSDALSEAQKGKEGAEAELALLGMSEEVAHPGDRVGLDGVSSSIQAGEALVAFARYERRRSQSGGEEPEKNADPVVSYAAFILRGGQATPALVDLGDAEVIDRLVLGVQLQMARVSEAPEMAGKRQERAYRLAADILRARVWDPVAANLNGVARVFVVPDGGLNLVSFAALPVGEAEYLIDGGMEIHYLSAERDLVSSSPTETGAGIVALGNPTFDQSKRFALLDEQDGLALASIGPQKEGQVFRGPRSSCGGFRQMRFDALPASARELDEVVALWTSGQGEVETQSRLRGPSKNEMSVVRLDGVAASETAFKMMAPGRRGLHLATHGFFLGGACPSALDSRGGASADIKGRTFAENPLLLSGLALAGANLREEAGEEEEDGILTAEEIASIDLSGVEWAVLSACNTGAGEIRAGEGVFGLRRAFRVAGVTTLVMSLWPVEDEASRTWMNAFYSQRFEEGRGIAGAVHAASLNTLTARRAAGESTHPFFWAGFVAAGR